MGKRDVAVGATEFKAKCLELMAEVHGHKRSSIVITKRGKPYVKVVPVEEARTPFRGSMKGTVKVLGDLTKPVEVEWEVVNDR